jgi:hypothetical protein
MNDWRLGKSHYQSFAQSIVEDCLAGGVLEIRKYNRIFCGKGKSCFALVQV